MVKVLVTLGVNLKYLLYLMEICGHLRIFESPLYFGFWINYLSNSSPRSDRRTLLAPPELKMWGVILSTHSHRHLSGAVVEWYSNNAGIHSEQNAEIRFTC